MNSVHANLRRLIIEKFDGDAWDWQWFWDQYESAIPKNIKMSNVDKLNYLWSYLKGAVLMQLKDSVWKIIIISQS